MRSDQADKGFIQSGLENLQEGRMHNLPGLRDPVVYSPNREKAFPFIISQIQFTDGLLLLIKYVNIAFICTI